MSTRILSHPAAILALFCALAAPLAALESNESNLTLLDTENPAIRDLAVEVGGITSEIEQVTRSEADTVYDNLSPRNKQGVFFSEGLSLESSSIVTAGGYYQYDHYGFNLLLPWKERGDWVVDDFLHSASGPMYFMNDGLYQPLPGALPDQGVLPWEIKSTSLGWKRTVAAEPFHFVVSLNNHSAGWDAPSSRVQLYKRFEFPSGLNYADQGDVDSELDRKVISNTAKKLVVVVHGWNTAPNTDPFTDEEWRLLTQNLSTQIKSKALYAADWDLYAYRWGRDSYTGDLGSMYGLVDKGAHASGGVGVGEENGTQAAEIGYQHGLVLGKLIRDHCAANQISLEKVHFIAHSAGTWVARSASLYLNAIKGSAILDQEITLLDPYMPHEGYVGWEAAPLLRGGEDSTLDKTDIEDWASTVAPLRCENIFSMDPVVFGTNEVYWKQLARQPWQIFANRQVGVSQIGKFNQNFSWNGHSGPINYFAYSVDPALFLKSISKNQSAYELWHHSEFPEQDPAGWDQSMFMAEYRANLPPLQQQLAQASGFSVLRTVIEPMESPSPRNPGPQPAPPAGSPWQQILVDVDSVGWVRAMLLPAAGGAAELAGPVRVEPNGTFAMDLSDGTVLAGVFDTTVTPVAITLTINGVPYGQKVAKAQGTLAQAGFDAQINAAGNMVFSMVLADGTAGMTVARDADNTGWEGSGVGTVDGNGAFTVTGGDGLQITGQLLAEGGLDAQATTVVAPQVPEIYVQNGAGTSLTSGASSEDCGRVQVGLNSSAMVLTIRNTGTVDLTDLGISVDGAHSGDFAVSALGTTTLAADASVSLQVVFTPGAAGNRTAMVHIASNDANENPFDIALTGNGFSATELASGTIDAVLTAGGESFYRVSVPGPGILIAWSEGFTDTYGAISNSGGAVLGEDNDSDLQANFRSSAAVVAGDYFVRVSGSDAATAGAYTLRTRFIPDTAAIEVSFLEKSGDDVNLGFTSRAGTSYSILGSDDMIEWTEITSATGSGAEVLVALPWHGVFPKRFFRVSSSQP